MDAGYGMICTGRRLSLLCSRLTHSLSHLVTLVYFLSEFSTTLGEKLEEDLVLVACGLQEPEMATNL